MTNKTIAEAENESRLTFTQAPPSLLPSWKVFEGDALSGLSTLDDDSVRCFVTSPPYFRKFVYGNDPKELGIEETVEAYIKSLTEIAECMYQKATRDANLFLVIQDTFNGSGGAGGDFKRKDGYGPHAIRGPRIKGWPQKAQLLIPELLRIAIARETGWIPIIKLVWDKKDSRRAAEDRPSYSIEEILAFSRTENNGLYEEIMLFSANPKHYWNRMSVLAEYAQASLKQLQREYTGTSRFDHSSTGTEDPSKSKRRMVNAMNGREGAYLRAVWNHSSGSQPVVETEEYGTVKGVASFPLLLAEVCVNLGSAPGDLVCDPFAGLGTTLLAAAKWGRNSFGIELSPRFAAATRQRMRDAGY